MDQSVKKRWIELLNVIGYAKKHSIAMQHKLLLYWIFMLLAVFGALLVVLSIMGVFSSTEQKLHQALKVCHKGAAVSIEEQVNHLTARGIGISKQAAYELDTLLYARPTSQLDNDAETLKQLEEKIYAELNTALQSSPCNGAYLVLDTTINSSLPQAETSRAGVYIRYINLNAKNVIAQDIVLFRGIADVARNNRLELHNQWKMEFDSSLIPGYTESLAAKSANPAENSFWTSRIQLTDTWEHMILLVVPIQGSDGSIRGICGLELGDLYMQLSYPAQESQYGSMLTVIAPMEEETLLLSRGMMEVGS